MAQFNLNEYETVEQRIRRFYGDHADGRITTELISADGDIGKTRWVVKAHVFRDRETTVPDGTGYAFEVDGAGMANKTSALENCETSAIGRALAQINYSGDKRATREEMAKTQRAQYQPSRDFIAEITKAALGGADGEAKNAIYKAAVADGAPETYLAALKAAGSGG